MSGFGWIAVDRFDLQRADATLSPLDVIAYLAKILRLDEFSIWPGMAIEILNLDNLPFLRQGIAVGHSHRAHESLPIFIQEIHSDGAMSVIRLLFGLGADDEGCGHDNLALEVLSRAATRAGSVPVLANEALGMIQGTEETAERVKKIELPEAAICVEKCRKLLGGTDCGYQSVT